MTLPLTPQAPAATSPDPTPVETLLINRGLIRAPVAGRHVGIWDLPGTDAMVHVWGDRVHVYRDTRSAATTYGIGEVEAVGRHLDGIGGRGGANGR